MINLLPEDTKKELRAARANVLLLRYNFFSAATLALLLVACGVFFILLHNENNQAKATNEENASKSTQYNSVREQSVEYRKNLATAKKILDNEVNYTDTVFRIADTLPAGAVLDSISLTPADIGGQVTLTVHTKDYATASALKTSFSDSEYFSNAFFQSITDTSASSTGNGQDSSAARGGYPITVNFSVKIENIEAKP